MWNSRVLAVAVAAVAMMVQGAEAADVPLRGLPPLPPPPVVDDFSGWYLRGDVGMTNQKLKNFHNVSMDGATGFAFNDPGSFDSGMFFGIGAGYQFNSWLRADLTGEYRGKTAFRAMDRYWDGAAWQTNDYAGAKSEWVGLANVYADLGTWWCLTPYVGAGLGFAYNTFHGYHDMNSNGGGGFAANASKWNFAWALHAGLAYKVTPGFTVELGYRYLSLGDAVTADVIRNDGVNEIYNPTTFRGLSSHDIKFGMRWMLGDPEPPMPVLLPPLVRKG